jgi:hypothetical protein
MARRVFPRFRTPASRDRFVEISTKIVDAVAVHLLQYQRRRVLLKRGVNQERSDERGMWRLSSAEPPASSLPRSEFRG